MYLIYFGVTFGYTAYFWGEDKVEHLFFGVFAYWLFGMVLLAWLLLFSTIANSAGQVLMGIGGVYAVMIFLNYIPALKKILPLRLMDGMQVSMGTLDGKELYPAFIFAGICILICAIIGMKLFDERKL